MRVQNKVNEVVVSTMMVLDFSKAGIDRLGSEEGRWRLCCAR